MRRRGRDPFHVGIAMLVVIALGSYLGFSKHVPFTHGFRLQAVFPSAVSIRVHSPVRIAGVDVGRVTAVRRYRGSSAALVSMDLKRDALPLHADATLKIRPRIFLEGNFFVELQPGTPSARTLGDGATVPITQTADPVQLDQVVSALGSDTRAALSDFLAGYGEALTHKPTPAEDRGQDPTVRGLSAAQALNRSYYAAAPALRQSAVVADALGGRAPHDVAKLVAGVGRVSAALDASESDLQGLIDHLDTTFGALASQAGALRGAVAQLPGALRGADATFAALVRGLPAVRAFADALVPAVRETPATIAAALPWIEQARALLGAAELGGVAHALATGTPALAALVPAQTSFFGRLDPVSRCLDHVVLPAGNAKLADGAQSAGVENYKEFLSALTGLTGESQNFDGNGPYERLFVGGGGQTVPTGPASIVGTKLRGGRLYARSALPLLGTRPAYPGAEPPYKPAAPCAKQALPDFNGPLASGPPDGSAGR
jgi:ABC-type transporter Mla subunit MlaD